MMVVLVWSHSAVAQDTAPIDDELTDVLDIIWLVIAGSLVFFMNAGFCLLETGFCRKQNAINILAKNLVVFSIATVAFWLCGAGLMFGGNNPWIGTEGFFFSGQDIFNPGGSDSLAMREAKFFFQLVFAGTAATIVSGAVAERMRFLSFLLFSFFLVGLLYPITGHWAWSESGWLNQISLGGSGNLAFWDFAGSTVVHTVGGAAGLMGTIALGARADKYRKIKPAELSRLNPREKTKFNKKIEPLNGHNITLATLGCLILWLGWFGFNAGSTLEATSPAIPHIVLTTTLAAAAGAIGSIIFCFVRYSKPNLAFIINGIVGGLVSITAPCAYVNLLDAVVIGAVGGGIFVPLVTELLDWWEIDDPVGAIPVHFGCGLWGTLAVGLFSIGPDSGLGWAYAIGKGPAQGFLRGGNPSQLIVQGLGAATVIIFILLSSRASFYLLAHVMPGGIKVSEQEEREGLDKFTFEDKVQDSYQDQIDRLRKQLEDLEKISNNN
ncbi:MAG: ammonium transporter [Moorea sp. SIO4A1]|uniref:ammonium transporter n=1 Tax=Moorena sp. SIO4A1 TaxID=2607835 RepID=UPI0013C90EE3|nr:ammonium transporter [Moorena sp. SIO4A1]NEO23232.1 ammonium transporter [Moorena sp. SIO4A5]NEQ60473.1 ammonium transporter [Moorena sp. SIO4A1]